MSGVGEHLRAPLVKNPNWILALFRQALLEFLGHLCGGFRRENWDLPHARIIIRDHIDDLITECAKLLGTEI